MASDPQSIASDPQSIAVAPQSKAKAPPSESKPRQVKAKARRYRAGSSESVPTALWQQEALSRANELTSLLNLFVSKDPPTPVKSTFIQSIKEDLESARDVARQRAGFRQWISGWKVQYTEACLDAAEVALRLAPWDFLDV